MAAVRPEARRTAPRAASYADLEALPEHVVGELIAGELHVSPRPAPPHAAAGSHIVGDLNGPFFRRPGSPGGPGGWWIFYEPELHIGGDVLVPDLAGWRRERMPTLPKTAWFGLVPDWVCEIVSPQSGRRDRMLKMPRYGAAGVAHIWLVDPSQHTLDAYAWQTAPGGWLLLGTWGGAEPAARVPPFDAVALDLSRWWDTGDEAPATGEELAPAAPADPASPAPADPAATP